MSFNFANLSIEKIIIHQIFKRDEKKGVIEPRYNNEFTSLDGPGLDQLQNRIIKALGSNSYCIEMEISNFGETSTFQSVAKLIRCSDNEFIEVSKQLARKLAVSQTTRRIPGGVVVVFKGKVGEDSKNYIGIIKAEKHGGFQLTELDANLLLQYISNLLLTPQQKLYKISMFIEVDESKDNVNRRPDEFKAYVFDHNMNKSETKDAALYFYETFLGCTISPTNKKLTREFYMDTRSFINNLDIDDEAKVDLNYALYSYLKVSQSPNIQVAEFAEQYLEGDCRDEYINFMEARKFLTNAIPKDLTYLKNKLKRRKINFTSDVTITAPSENFKDLVKIVKSENMTTVVEIKGLIGAQD